MLLKKLLSTTSNETFQPPGGYRLQIAALKLNSYLGMWAGNSLMGLGYDFNVAMNVDIRAEYNHMDSIGGNSNIAADTIMIGVIGKF